MTASRGSAAQLATGGYTSAEAHPPDRERPGKTGASSKLDGDQTSSSLSIVPPTTVGTSDELQEYATAIDGAFAVVVRTAHGRYRRRVWLTLAPAERAVEKAIEAGHNAEIMIVELRPVYRVAGGGRDGC